MRVFLLTPPFTQLNTPYPATAYLKGFLNTRGVSSEQADLGIDVILELFSAQGLRRLFNSIQEIPVYENSARIYAMRQHYIDSIDRVISFLQGKDPTLALQICQEEFLPEASRFEETADLEWSFGMMGTQDKAKHLATLYLEDISDFIVDCIDPWFGFSRYAESLGRSAATFDEIYQYLQSELSLIEQMMLSLLSKRLLEAECDLVVISIPFPGNLFAAMRCGQYIKKHFPHIKIAMGGGFPNTELRSLSDPRVFECTDFITLDDGEAPLSDLIEYLEGSRSAANLKRCFMLCDGIVQFQNGSATPDVSQSQTGTPDYTGLPLERYISVIEIVNPMHRMWSDGRWNKLTMAHGCYWGKCTFCDISLDYIKIYEPVAASLLCDRVEELIRQTGTSGFHFVDEAAPPALMRAFALEVLKRRISISWWTNIRFEKSFSADLCVLLRASGCIAVSGGLEVASDRLLKLIDKGVTVEQVAKVTRNFTEAGIMVHAYLMYGYPSQTIQETIDSLEMVRQMFESNILQSGFWHRFAMTAHSPVGLEPGKYGVIKNDSALGTFANNDIEFTDTTGIDHERFGYGLKKSLYNYMHGAGFDLPLKDWFDFRIPPTRIPRNFIQNALQTDDFMHTKPTSKIVWIGGEVTATYFVKTKKGSSLEIGQLHIHTKKNQLSIQAGAQDIRWLVSILPRLQPAQSPMLTFSALKSDYEAQQENFELFWYAPAMQSLKKVGLLSL